jgi:hypothetical protein
LTGAAFRKLQAEWDRRLADDGFQDLESANRDAPMSNRGKIHPKYEDGGPALVERLEHGAEYIRWCQQVLHTMHPTPGRGGQRRKVWRLHAQGDSLKTIAGKLDLNFHVVRATVMKIEEKHRCEKKEPRTPAERLALARRTVRRIPTTTLVRLAAIMVKATRMSSPLRSVA